MKRGETITIEVELSLLEEFPDFMDCVRDSVYGCGKQFKYVAADLHVSDSRLSRMLSAKPGDPTSFPLRRLPDLMAVTGDTRPAQWLVLRFLVDSDMRHRRAIEQLAEMMPTFVAMAAQLGIVQKGAR